MDRIPTQQFINHVKSVLEMFGIYEGICWDIVCAQDNSWRVVGRNNAFEFSSILNKESVIYTDIKLACREFLFLEPNWTFNDNHKKEMEL